MNSGIGLADAIRTLLAFPETDRERALGLLGFRLRRASAASAPVSRPRPPQKALVDRPQPLRDSRKPTTLNDALVARIGGEPQRDVGGWWDDVEALELEPALSDEPQGLLAEPLFNPPWQRSLLTAALSGQAPSSRIDFPKLIARIAAAAPITELPRRLQASLRGGLQLVADMGPTMVPFYDDVAQVAAEVRKLFPAESLQTIVTEGPPAIGEEPYTLPLAGTTVLIVSNFGLSMPHGFLHEPELSRWLRFLAALACNQRTSVALVPLDRSSIPASLRRLVAIVPWDRRTGTGEILRARRLA